MMISSKTVIRKKGSSDRLDSNVLNMVPPPAY
jgi:hypothetical protein